MDNSTYATIRLDTCCTWDFLTTGAYWSIAALIVAVYTYHLVIFARSLNRAMDSQPRSTLRHNRLCSHSALDGMDSDSITVGSNMPSIGILLTPDESQTSYQVGPMPLMITVLNTFYVLRSLEGPLADTGASLVAQPVAMVTLGLSHLLFKY